MTTPTRPAGIVFDLDGTLVDSLALTFEAFNHGIAVCGGRPHTPAEIMAHFGMGEAHIFARLIGPELADRAYAATLAFTDEHVHRVPLFAGAGDLLERLKSAGVPVSIFTGRSWNTTELILKHHGLLDRFVTVVAHDHVGASKPSPEGLFLALKRMQLDPHEVLFVGDSAMDILAARAAGSVGVAALWDLLVNRTTLEAARPHHWARAPEDVWGIWERGEQKTAP